MATITAWISDMHKAECIPGFVAYGVFVGEIVAPVLIILGYLARHAALIYVVNILIATLLVGTGKFFMVTRLRQRHCTSSGQSALCCWAQGNKASA